MKITRYRKIKTKDKEQYQLVFNLTPFYAESGGQVGDTGHIEADGDKVEITDTKRENNVIIHFADSLPKDPSQGFKAVIDIALNGVFYVTREVGRLMRSGGGSIVNISAPYASGGKPGVVHSACAKAGVESMTRTLAAEWARYGIRVNAVSPGPFESTGAAERLWPSEELEKAVLDQIPLGRFA